MATPGCRPVAAPLAAAAGLLLLLRGRELDPAAGGSLPPGASCCGRARHGLAGVLAAARLLDRPPGDGGDGPVAAAGAAGRGADDREGGQAMPGVCSSAVAARRVAVAVVVVPLGWPLGFGPSALVFSFSAGRQGRQAGCGLCAQSLMATLAGGHRCTPPSRATLRRLRSSARSSPSDAPQSAAPAPAHDPSCGHAANL